jgi:hypothetical protein
MPWSQSDPIRRVLLPCRALSHTTRSLGHCLSLFHKSYVDFCFPQSHKCVYLNSNDANSRFIWESYLAEEIMCSVVYSWICSRQIPARIDTRGLRLTAPLMHQTAFSRNRLRSDKELHLIIVVLIHIIINLVQFVVHLILGPNLTLLVRFPPTNSDSTYSLFRLGRPKTFCLKLHTSCI